MRMLRKVLNRHSYRMSTNSIPPRLLVAGLFLIFSLIAREVRAQPPGSPDPTFGATNSYRGPVYSLASLGDGRVLLGSSSTAPGQETSSSPKPRRL